MTSDTADMAVLLEITGLTLQYETGRPAVRDVSLTLRRGERLAVVGQSGSGKTTLVSAVTGLMPGRARIVSGGIRFDDTDLTGAGEGRFTALRGKRIAYVPQDPMSNLDPTMRIGAQLDEVIAVHESEARPRARRARAIELLAEVGIPDPARRLSAYPHEFSGGMQQRVLIAMAMAHRPDLLIADEPTSALDVTLQRQVLDLLDRLVAEHSTSLLLVTHDLALAAERADSILVMHDGQIVENGSADAIFTAPRHEYTKRLLTAAPTPTAPTLIDAEESFDSAAVPVLELRDVTKRFRERGTGLLRRQTFTAVEGVCLQVPEARTVAIVGESGSGKSTTARLILGLERLDEGAVVLDGTTISGLSHRALAPHRRRLQFVPQNPYASLDPRLSVASTIREPLDVHRVGSSSDRARRVAELMDLVALPRGTADRRPHALSGGQRQRVAIARAIALDPRLLVLDEAVSALDVLVQEQILQLLVELQQQLRIAYLFISHDLSVVRQVAHQVHVFQHGRIVESGAPATIFARPAHPYTAELVGAIPGFTPSAAAHESR